MISLFRKRDARRGDFVLKKLLTERMIRFSQEELGWKEAIQTAAAPLLEAQHISEEYVRAMIQNIEAFGPYVIIGPGIAIPHARPEQGVYQVGMSLLKLEQPTYFLDKEEHKIQLIICLAATDATSHLKALAQLTRLLSNPSALRVLQTANRKEDILSLIEKYST